MLATALVLVAALLHAAWNTLIKFSGERPFGRPRLLACGLVLIGMLIMKF